MNILVDMDGVICTEEKTFERSLAKPLPGAREGMAAMIKAGHTVTIYTSRSWAELEMTKAWLHENGIPFSGIHMGKPIGDKFIDDRGMGFNGWDQTLSELGIGMDPPIAGEDEALLRILRERSVEFLRAIAERSDLLEPVLEVGAMTWPDASDRTSVFRRMPDLFCDSRTLFREADKKYMSLDIRPDTGADISGSFLEGDSLLSPGSIGTLIMLSVMQHITRVWEVPRIAHRMLKTGGRAFLLTPWNLRFHGPRPDCWRISDDGYEVLFREGFEFECLDKIECPGRALSPIAIKCIVRKV